MSNSSRTIRSSSKKRKAFALAPVVVASIAIFIASSLTAITPPSLGFEWQDKLFHALSFFFYGLCVQFAVLGWNVSMPSTRAFFYVALIGIAYGISDEVHQSFVPSRMAEVADAIADAFGVLLSTAFLGFTRRLLLRLGW